MSTINKEKAMDVLNGAKEKAKDALFEIKTNFKADEGTSGARKIKSMFANLWKSGTTGKAALIASAVVVLLLPWMLGTSKEDQIKNLMHEIQEVSIELCELDDLLGHKDLFVPWALGRSLEKEGTVGGLDMKELKGATSKELDAFITMNENMLKELKAELPKKKAECKKKGIEIGESSPLRVARNFILCLRAKDVKGMKKLIRGDETVKENAVKGFLDGLDSKQGQEIFGRLEAFGPTIFNEARNLAGIPLDDEGEVCLRLVKTEDGWLLAGRKGRPEKPVCSKRRIIENAD